MKYYVVIAGRKPGIYTTWAECEAQTKGFKGAKFKSYPNRQDAENALRAGDIRNKPLPETKRTETPKQPLQTFDKLPTHAISVDVGTKGNPGPTEYRIVNVHTRQELYRSGVFGMGTNNLGELLGLLHGIKYASMQTPVPVVYSDSKLAISWLRKRAYNSTLPRTRESALLFDQIDKGFEALARDEKMAAVVVSKWETKIYGEIPADFNRK